QRLAVRHARALDLEVVAPREELRPLRGELLRGIRVAGRERLADVARGEARERDEALGAELGEPLARDLGARPVLVLQPRAREQLREPEIPGARGAKQEQPRGLVAVGLVLDPAIGADDRLHARAA